MAEVAKVAIICAVEPELAPFLNEMRDTIETKAAMLSFFTGKLAGAEVVAVCCGVCKVNAAIATALLIAQFTPGYVIMSGTAGGIDKTLRIGDTVVSTATAYHDVADGILTRNHPFLPENNFPTNAALLAHTRKALAKKPVAQPVYYGKIVTGEAFITIDGRADIIERHQPLCVDMETAAAAHVCHVNNVPFLAVRSITDTADNAGEGAFFTHVKQASVHSFLVVKSILSY